MSVTAAEGFVAAGCHAGIKRRKLRHGDDRDRGPPAGALRGRVHAEQVRRTAGRARPRDAARQRRQGRGGHRQFGQCQCREPARPGCKRCALMAAATAHALQRRQCRTCSSARPGSSARRCRWSRSSNATPKLAKKLSVDGARRCGARHPHDGPQAQASRDPGLDLHARRHGQGLRHDRAQHGDDAGLPDDRCRRAARADAEGPAAQRPTRPSTRSMSTARPRPTTPRCCSRRAGAARPIPTSSPMPCSPPADDLTMQMARDAEGMTRIARLTVTGAANDNEARSRPRRSSRTISSSAAGTAAIPIGAGCWPPRDRAGVDAGRRQVARQLWRDHRRRRAASASSMTARRSPSI